MRPPDSHRQDENLLLEALILASSKADSKLKAITFQARSSKFNSEVLEEARRRFAVNLPEETDPDPDPDPALHEQYGDAAVWI